MPTFLRIPAVEEQFLSKGQVEPPPQGKGVFRLGTDHPFDHLRSFPSLFKGQACG